MFVDRLKLAKGSDASNAHDEEPGEDEVEFSDDEQEAAYKRMLKERLFPLRPVLRPALITLSALGVQVHGRPHEQQPLVPLQEGITTNLTIPLEETTHTMNTVFMTPIMGQVHLGLHPSPMTTLTLILSPASQTMEMEATARHLGMMGVQFDRLM